MGQKHQNSEVRFGVHFGGKSKVLPEMTKPVRVAGNSKVLPEIEFVLPEL